MYATRSRGTQHRKAKAGALPRRKPNRHRTRGSVIRTLVRLTDANGKKTRRAMYLLPSGKRTPLPRIPCATSTGRY